MYQDIDLSKIIFLDIETVPLVYNHNELDKKTSSLWDKKSHYYQKQGITAEEAYQKAGIFAEFGKVVCISVAYLVKSKQGLKLRLTSFYGHDEKQILENFNQLLNKTLKKNYLLCAHNGKEFDFPFLARRILINGLKLPEQLRLAGKKPWEVPHLDTMELWRFGDYKNYTSLDLLAHTFNIPTPKANLDGSKIAYTYYEEKDLKKIVEYCSRDVVAVAQLFLRFSGKELIHEENIEMV